MRWCVQVLLSDGTVWAWGSNYYGQLGLGLESQVRDVTGLPKRAKRLIQSDTLLLIPLKGPADDNGPKPFRPSSPRTTMCAAAAAAAAAVATLPIPHISR